MENRYCNRYLSKEVESGSDEDNPNHYSKLSFQFISDKNIF